MGALEVLQGTTHSLSAGAPFSRLRRFHLPHWESLLTDCGFYKGLINIPLRPKPGRRLQHLRGQSRGLVLLEKGTGAAETMLYQSCIGRARMETRPSKEHTRCACVCHLILRSSKGKEGTGQKVLGKQRGQIRLSGLTPDKFTNREPLLGWAWRR
ncbi:uncharacterized protein LOC119559661 [Drosophila subpulchrella]|uniref:uncharacterized protein LOC119559661 n=1 Tax=Drosophila subpulchrella TaxID=1486046 RepID=UPI0018A1AD13|nr:uncharacterized protein LOC119559661 [Drosophila subpulchrella]